ncbi:MAG: tyrosine-protein phosphatase [Clostridia bacterium]|nr:tyrosine-protein phosphatase [Clostridia bacterium]
MFQKLFSILLVILSLLTVYFGNRQSPSSQTPVPETAVTETEDTQQTITVAIRSINKHGNVILETTFEALKEANIEVSDIITVFAGENAFDLPVGTSFTDVSSGGMVCRFDLEDNEVALAINMGDFASVTGIAEKQTIDENPGYRWEIKTPEVQLMLKEKRGYFDEYTVRNLTRTDAREDYAHLTDAQFANFRAVAADAIRPQTLYRSSSPLDPSIGRSAFAMAAMEQAGVRTVINLTDAAAVMKNNAAFANSYYSTCAVIYPEMSYDFESAAFAGKVRDSVLFLLANDGPYLVHCKEGKDRTGIFCAILECFAGADWNAVATDYMLTYSNFYGIRPTDTVYSLILRENLLKTLGNLFGTENIETANLKNCAAQYLRSIGLSAQQLEQLTETLAAKEGPVAK